MKSVGAHVEEAEVRLVRDLVMGNLDIGSVGKLLKGRNDLREESLAGDFCPQVRINCAQ